MARIPINLRTTRKPIVDLRVFQYTRPRPAWPADSQCGRESALAKVKDDVRVTMGPAWSAKLEYGVTG
jgi:hypothetical protein